ncbi:MAG TPA: transglycosylase SLT domain-containing protein [Labilithrix sp.]|nr:transglycosylase SLT domain-containing protein [Labilithrix sp.]
MKQRLSLLALLLGAVTGCPRRDAPVPGNAGLDGDVAAPDASLAEVADAGDAARAAAALALPWTEAIRGGKWKEAEEAIAALPDGEQKKPEVRFARARVALALGKHAEAVARIEKLEDELPLLRDAMARIRAQAALVVGPYDRAGEWYAARPTASSWLVSADAWDKAGDPTRARAQCDRILSADKRGRALEEKARALRMKIVRAKDGDAAAVADARWLATNALDDTTAAAATELLDKLARPAPLTAEDLITRSRVLADAGRSDEALRAAERAGNASGAGSGKSTPLDLCHARAEAYYKARSRYPEAALAYRSCAAMGGPRAAEDSFLAARAFSRADRDADALPAFAAVIQRHPRTTWADQAEFHVARSHALAGRWKEAAQALDDYLKHFPAGHDKREAERYRAISHLNAHDFKIARKLLEDLAGGDSDGFQQARWTNLAAFAALKDGDRLHAVARWSEVARSRPLSWPALVARARLGAASAPLPLTIDPAETGDAPERLAVELPPPVDTLHRIGLDGDAEEALREREAIVTAKAQGRGTEALCAAYAMLDRGKRRYQISLQIPAQLLATAPGPRNRWAWDCAYPRPHKGSIRDREDSAKLPPDLLWAVMRQESAFDEEVVSPARAVGLLQLMPETAKAVASGAGLPHEEAWLVRADHNIALGALYMRDLLDKLGGNVSLAAGAYNAGPDAINRWQSHAKGETLDIFVETIPFLETRGYVVRVMGNLARYGYLDRGEAGVPAIALDPK